MPLAANLNAVVQISYTGSRQLEQQASGIDTSFPIFLRDGAGATANAASVMWSDRRTLASGASESLDLNGTALIDGLGAAVALARIKGIIIRAAVGNTTDLTIGNVANGISTIFGAATQTLVLQPGELLIKMTPSAAGYLVTAGTADLLRIVNAAGASATYDIIIIGSGT